MNKTTEALKQSLDALSDTINALLFLAPDKPMRESAVERGNEALAAIREALADQFRDATKMVGCAYCDNPLFAGTKCNNCGRVTLAEPVKPSQLADASSEPVAWHHPECEGECIACLIERCVKDSYGTQGLDFMLRHINAAPVDAKANAKEKYDKFMAECEEPDPIERLRFFCSLAMGGKNWIDVEKFFDDLIAERKAIRAEALEEAAKVCDWYTKQADINYSEECTAAIRGLKSNNH